MGEVKWLNDRERGEKEREVEREREREEKERERGKRKRERERGIIARVSLECKFLGQGRVQKCSEPFCLYGMTVPVLMEKSQACSSYRESLITFGNLSLSIFPLWLPEKGDFYISAIQISSKLVKTLLKLFTEDKLISIPSWFICIQ